MRRFGVGIFGKGFGLAEDWLAYASVYEDSVRILLQEIKSNFLYQHHAYQILPLLFLLEMYIELQLKGLIIYKGGLSKPEHSLSEHFKLLESLDSSIRMSEQTKDFIKRLSELDNKSQAFRYPTDRNLRRFFQNLSPDLSKLLYDINDFQELEKIVKSVIRDLENIEGDFEYEQDIQGY